VFAAIRRLLDAHDQLTEAYPNDRRRIGPLILAATVARTPDVPVPASEPSPAEAPAGSAGAEAAQS
jgi:hypothetical protein